MTFKILEILDSTSENVLAKVDHQNHQLTAIIRDMKDKEILLDTPIQAEISFDQILDWKVLADFEDAQSGIWQGQDGIHLVGRIHSILDYGDGRMIMDIYMQNGPELFTVNLETAEDQILDANDGLEFIVDHLYLHPIL